MDKNKYIDMNFKIKLLAVYKYENKLNPFPLNKSAGGVYVFEEKNTTFDNS